MADVAAAEHESRARHQNGLLRLLPAAERDLRHQVFDLEDDCAQMAHQKSQQQHENYQARQAAAKRTHTPRACTLSADVYPHTPGAHR